MRSLCEPPPTFNRQLLIWSPMFDFFWLHQTPLNRLSASSPPPLPAFSTFSSCRTQLKSWHNIDSLTRSTSQTERKYKNVSVQPRELLTAVEASLVPGAEGRREYGEQGRVWCCYLFVPAVQLYTSLLYTSTLYLPLHPPTPPPHLPPTTPAECNKFMQIWNMSE